MSIMHEIECGSLFTPSLVPRPYFFLLLSLFIQERHSEAAKKEMGVQLIKKSKAWFGKSRDPQGFL